MPPPPDNIAHRVERPGVLRVCLTGEFDMVNSADLFASLRRCIDDPGVRHVILDLSGTTFMDSSGIRAVMEGHYLATQQGKVLAVDGWTTGVRRVFEILELADALVVADDREDGPPQ